jgi:hypothetical protein
LKLVRDAIGREDFRGDFQFSLVPEFIKKAPDDFFIWLDGHIFEARCSKILKVMFQS